MTLPLDGIGKSQAATYLQFNGAPKATSTQAASYISFESGSVPKTDPTQIVKTGVNSPEQNAKQVYDVAFPIFDALIAQGTW